MRGKWAVNVALIVRLAIISFPCHVSSRRSPLSGLILIGVVSIQSDVHNAIDEFPYTSFMLVKMFLEEI